LKSIKYTKEERKAQKKKLDGAMTEAERIINAAAEAGITICARETTGLALGLDMEEFRSQGGGEEERLISLLPPYEDWKISFWFGNLGLFKVRCSTYELRREAVLALPDINSLLKILVEQPEVERFSKAIQQSITEKGNEFNEIFERIIKVVPGEITEERVLQLIRTLVVQTEKTLKKHIALQEGEYHLRKPTMYLPGEKKLLGKIPGEEAREALARGLQA
jgi:hypothetical protein